MTGAAYVMELYRAGDPTFEGRATVPFVYDTRDQRIVTNDYPQITLHLETARAYKAGFAITQQAYEEVFDALFAQLDRLDARLATQRYLIGDRLTEADVRLFTTLVRFDAAYHGHFTCNLCKLTDYEHRWPYARDLFQAPGFGDTTDFDQMKRHYYATHEQIKRRGARSCQRAT